MKYKGHTTLEERVRIAERVDAGYSSREIALELGGSGHHSQMASPVSASRMGGSGESHGASGIWTPG